MRAEGRIGDGVDGEHRRAQITTDDEVVEGFVAAGAIRGSVNDPSNELNESGCGEETGVAIEVPA